MNPQQTPQIASLEDFVSGGLYQGGTGRVESIRVVLWDYNGKQPPNSICAIKMVFQPTDGSNSNEKIENFWSVGPATEFQPSLDGTQILSLNGKGISDNSNWHFVYEKFSKNCGLQKGALANGLSVLDGSELTLARMDPPKRDFADNAAPDPAHGGQPKKAANQILAPTRARFAWEQRGAVAPAPAAFHPPTPAPTPGAAVPAAAPLPAANTANGAVANDLGSALAVVLASVPSVNINDPSFQQAMLTALSGVDRVSRMAVLKEAKDMLAIEEAAIARGWKFDVATTTLSR